MLLHTFDFIIDVPTANCRSDYSSEKLIKYYIKPWVTVLNNKMQQHLKYQHQRTAVTVQFVK